MKKIIVFVFGLFCFFSFAEINKVEVLNEITKKYENVSEINGEIEIKMDMMGKTMTMPMKFWAKEKKFKMETVYQEPGMEKPMEIVMLMDGEKLIQYQKSINTVIKFDLTKFPEELKKDWEKQYNFKDNIPLDIEKISNNVDLEIKNKGGKEYYVLTINNLQTLNIPGLQNINGKSQFFTKSVVWINRDNLLPESISYFADKETPGMEIVFKSLNLSPINEDIFKINIPDDAKVLDMTDMMINMANTMKQQITTPQLNPY